MHQHQVKMRRFGAMKWSETQNISIIDDSIGKRILSDNVGRNVILYSPYLLIVRAAVTNYYKLGSLNNRNSLSLSSGGLKFGMSQVDFFLRAMREGCLPGLCPWLVDGHLLLFTSVHNCFLL